jgi:molybdate/tungstate transport system permease protein
VDALPGALIAVSYLSATYAVRAVESAIRSLNLELENAARILGTGPFRALISIALSKVNSAVINRAALLVLIRLGGWAPQVVAYHIVVGNTSVYPASIYIYQVYIDLGHDGAVMFSAALVLFVFGVFLAYCLAVSHAGAEKS